MRTTIAIDDDVLAAAKELAAMGKKSLGEVISELARQALRPPQVTSRSRNSVPLLAVRPGAARVTSELVQQLRDELP